uniref:Uncharacterized protein n=1 Tax=Tanacetum cinerariifolium TaxID=118510 RepID=A0A699HGW2_TANCI|nr:hypothetical protein [Tanacetum cinerariifolium]
MVRKWELVGRCRQAVRQNACNRIWGCLYLRIISRVSMLRVQFFEIECATALEFDEKRIVYKKPITVWRYVILDIECLDMSLLNWFMICVVEETQRKHKELKLK